MHCLGAFVASPHVITAAFSADYEGEYRDVWEQLHERCNLSPNKEEMRRNAPMRWWRGNKADSSNLYYNMSSG